MSCEGIGAGELRHRISILDYTTGKDAIGMPTTDYFTLCHLSAKVEFSNAVEVKRSTKETVLTTVIFTTRYRAGLDKKMLVVFDGNVYDIKTIIKIGAKKQYIEIKAVHAFEFNKIDMPIPAEIRIFAGAAAPTGWLICDGTSYATTAYPDLFNVIGYDYGGSGANFNVPDLCGRAAVGAGTGQAGLTARTLAVTGGAETHSLAESEMPAHNHTALILGVPGEGETGAMSGLGGGVPGDGNYFAHEARGNSVPDIYKLEDGSVPTVSLDAGTVSVASTGGGGSHQNMQPFLALNYIIAVR